VGNGIQRKDGPFQEASVVYRRKGGIMRENGKVGKRKKTGFQ
jgi:hypothetical protein